MARVNFSLNELSGRDISLGRRVEGEIRNVLVRFEPEDLLVECRITLQGSSEQQADRIGIQLSSPGNPPHPGWAIAFGLALDAAGTWLREPALIRALGLVER